MALPALSSEILQRIVGILDVEIDGSWGELYMVPPPEAGIIALVIMVGEPKRRKLEKKIEAVTQELEKTLGGQRAQLTFTSPEKKIHKGGKCLKKW